MQPRAGDAPVALDGGGRDAERFGCFRHREASEKPRFHHSRLARVDLLELFERLVQCDHLVCRFRSDGIRVIQGDGLLPAAPLRRPTALSVVHKDLPHGTGGHRHEVASIVPPCPCMIH